MTSGSGAPKRVLSEEAITFKRLRGQIEYLDRRKMCSKTRTIPDSTHTTKVLCEHNSFGVGH